MTITRSICNVLTSGLRCMQHFLRFKRGADLPPSGITLSGLGSVDEVHFVPSRQQSCTESELVNEEETWHALNCLSCSTTSSHFSAVISTRSLCSTIADNGDETSLQTPRLPKSFSLCEGLYFYDPSEEQQEGVEPTLLHADRVVMWFGKGGSSSDELQVVGSRRQSGLSMDDPEESWCSPRELLVDCRLCADDEPNLITLLDSCVGRARLNKICFSGKGMCVEMSAPNFMDNGNCISYKSLEEVVCLLRAQEVDRRNSEMLIYQRQLCSMMMSNQRRRYLGLDKGPMTACR